jgi:hypothetical protein
LIERGFYLDRTRPVSIAHCSGMQHIDRTLWLA